MSHSVAQFVARLTDAYELIAGDPAELEIGTDQSAASRSTLAECVPLLAVAVELINRGPASLTIEDVEHYRARIMQLLDHIRPVVESEANLLLADWTSRLADETPMRRAA